MALSFSCLYYVSYKVYNIEHFASVPHVHCISFLVNLFLKDSTYRGIIYIIIYLNMCKYIVNRRRRRMGIWEILLCRFFQYSSSLRTKCRPGFSSNFPYLIFMTKNTILHSLDFIECTRLKLGSLLKFYEPFCRCILVPQMCKRYTSYDDITPLSSMERSMAYYPSDIILCY